MKRIVLALAFLLSALAVAHAQTDYAAMLEVANDYYNKGNFESAAKTYKMMQKEFGNDNVINAKLKDCNLKIKEKEDFENCFSIADCNAYLTKYPNGSYVDQVKQKRAEMIKANVNAAEDDREFQSCASEEDYRDYLRRHPYGRHVKQAKSALKQYEEDLVYQNCYTEEDCNAYLKNYPNGRYYEEVMEKLREFEEERLRQEMKAAETAYMNIKRIEFANTHSTGAIINDYGSTLYLTDIKFLTPKISYDGLMDSKRRISVFCKIIRPDGGMMYDFNSPAGYTYSHIFNVEPGNGNYYELPPWGSYDDGLFEGGLYRFELWFKDRRVYQTFFEIIDKENDLSRGNWRTTLNKCCDNVSHRSDDGSIYKGQYVNYRRSGLGMYSWKGLFYYIGQWDDSFKEGIGIEIAPSGSSLSNCPDCVYYVGEYHNDMKSGIGTCYDIYGNLIYYGSFENDKPTQNYPMTGFESYKFECIEKSWGVCYVGETRDGKPNGQGLYIWQHGDLWYGPYFDGRRDGYGILMDYYGEITTGVWKGDVQQ